MRSTEMAKSPNNYIYWTAAFGAQLWFSGLQVSTMGGVQIIKLNRPSKLNAFNQVPVFIAAAKNVHKTTVANLLLWEIGEAVENVVWIPVLFQILIIDWPKVGVYRVPGKM